jgi:formate hydrogenlyase subunit 6/NADH:ubiquinone oxidoreductase subunit I
VYDEVETVEDLPIGWTDEQDGGTYHMLKRDDAAVFGYTASPQSWKRFLYPEKRRLWQATRKDDTEPFIFIPEQGEVPRYAFLGVRACEMHAIAVQDRVFVQGAYIDPLYKAMRDNTFVVAVNCGKAGGTCFCESMQTGPEVTSGFDLLLTEILDDARHVFLCQVGTKQGAALLEMVTHEPAADSDRHAAQQIVEHTAHSMGRQMNTKDIKNFLYANSNHARWEDVANRCLSCANCTIVCPTCFCSTTEDVTDLSGTHAERWQRWDSCFTMDFSYIHGGNVRASSRSRYRQWMTHKLAYWIDQFGTSGCVGCGRCITWCPVGIDITEEVQAMHDEGGASSAEISTLNMV